MPFARTVLARQYIKGGSRRTLEVQSHDDGTWSCSEVLESVSTKIRPRVRIVTGARTSALAYTALVTQGAMLESAGWLRATFASTEVL